MKSVPTALSNAIKQNHTLYAQPKLIAEWNMNRYGSPSADNIPAEATDGYDADYFPIESIYQPNRPTKGVNKARVGEAQIAENTPLKQNARYYIVSDDDVYRYWCSPYESGTNGVFQNASDGRTVVRPHVLYDTPVVANKIVIKLENHWASPNSYEVLVKPTKATAWNYTTHVVANNPTIKADGSIVLYYTGTGWNTAVPTTTAPTTTIGGIMIKVNSLGPGKDLNGNTSSYTIGNDVNGSRTTRNTTGASSFFNLIEISARREVDLTGRLITVQDNFDISAESFIYPIGTTTSNTATITLSNIDGIFNSDNNDVIDPALFDLPIEPNVNFNLQYIYTVAGTNYTVQQFNMYGGPWNGQTDESVTIELTDFSKYLNETKPSTSFYQGRTASEVIWRICDQVGFVDYEVQDDDLNTQPIIDHFWNDGEKTAWEIIDEISRATQTAVYFDSWGKLQVKPRTTAFNKGKTIDWTLLGQNSGTTLCDIISMEKTGELEANNVTVTYKGTEASPWNKGRPATQRVWSGENTIVLRASPIVRSIESTDSFVWLPPEDVDVWPYSGILQVQGELIKYNGKQYVYYDGGTKNMKLINSKEEKDKMDSKTAFANRHLNHFTGGLYVTERGLWNSEQKRHPVEAEGYSVRNIVGGSRSTGVVGFRHDKQESTITLNTPARMDAVRDLMVATRGTTADSGFYYYGTKVRFNGDGSIHQRAGLVFHNNGNNEDGYYIEITPTNKLSTEERAQRNEVLFFSRKNGANHTIGGDAGRGVARAIRGGKYYEIDVTFQKTGTTDTIIIHLNGILAMTVTVPSAYQNPFNGKFGVHARGQTSASFEYLYAIARESSVPAEDVSFLDKVYGGYVGNQWDREWVYGWRDTPKRRKKKTGREQRRWNKMFFDEFGPVAHEVREFNVKFDPHPVLHSYPYIGNTWQAMVAEYVANPFGANFIVANTSRQNAVINGDDSLSFAGSGDTVSQVLTIIGRPLIIKDEEKITVKNDSQIRSRGNIEVDITSDWIQNTSAAQKIADWIVDHWSAGLDILTITMIGNPLIELGDVIGVTFNEFDMTATTHQYFVTATSTTFDEGMETAITLRRKR